MQKNNFVSLVSVLFLVIGLVHLWRALSGWEAVIGGVVIPIWASWIAVVVALFLSFSGFRLAKGE